MTATGENNNTLINVAQENTITATWFTMIMTFTIMIIDLVLPTNINATVVELPRRQLALHPHYTSWNFQEANGYTI